MGVRNWSTASTSGGSPLARRCPTAAPCRRHPRRQPPLGPRRRREATSATATAPAPTTSSTCSRGAPRPQVEVVTLWLLSSDNLSRPAEELLPLLDIIEATVIDLAAADQPWRVHPVGSLDLLRDSTVRVLKEADEATRDKSGLIVNVAIGYGGRREIADAVRSLLQEHATRGASLEEVASVLDVEHIADHLYTRGQPDPDLVIRTSGEQRLGGFMLWQSAHSEFYFCDALWPDFRKIDFLRALRSYAQRERRHGA